jgi:putative Mg2+ transporter-C (MgtC) family protein
VHLDCERRSGSHIRALLQAPAASGPAPLGLRAGRDADDAETTLQATVAISGDATAALGQVVTELSPAADAHRHPETESLACAWAHPEGGGVAPCARHAVRAGFPGPAPP